MTAVSSVLRPRNKSLAFLRHTLGLVYTIVLLSVGMATSMYFAMTEDTSQATQFHDAFFFAVYLTGVIATVCLAIYMWACRGASYQSRRHQARLVHLALGDRLAGMPERRMDSSEAVLPYIGHCGEGFNAYLRFGLGAFTLGTVAMNLLLIAAPNLDAGVLECAANPFKLVMYVCQLVFVVACGGLLALGHRAVFLRHRGIASALLGHQLTACLCIWAHSSVAEISEAVLLSKPLGNGSRAGLAEAACPEQRQAMDSVGQYLNPAKIEFALLAAPMTLQLLGYVGDRRLVEDTLAAQSAASGASKELGEAPTRRPSSGHLGSTEGEGE